MRPMKIFDMSIGQVFSYRNMIAAECHASKGRRYRADVMEFRFDLDSNIHDLQRQLLNETFRFGPYEKHVISIPKNRTVMALPYHNRIVQWRLYMALYDFFDPMLIETCFACRKGKAAFPDSPSGTIWHTSDGHVARGIQSASNQIQYWLRHIQYRPGKWYCVKIDIMKFFYRIDHDILFDILARRIADEKLLRLIRHLIDGDGEHFGLPLYAKPDNFPSELWLPDKGIPIGNLTSQLFANIYVNELDQFAKNVLKIRYYARYMDDIIAFTQSKAEACRILEAIRDYASSRLKLVLHPDKTRIFPLFSEPIIFVGRRITRSHMTLCKEPRKRMKRSIKGICKKFNNGELQAGDVINRLSSYSGMIKSLVEPELRMLIDESINGIERSSQMSNSPLISCTILSPNHSGRRTHKIDTVAIHCMAGNSTIESCGAWFAKASTRASSNYGIGSDGRIALYVDEANRSWCTSSSAVDQRAVTIEVANTKVGEPYPVSSAAYESLIKLLVDICQRNGIPKLIWKENKSDRIHRVDGANMQVHRDYVNNKSCPGQYLYERHGQIADEVNAILSGKQLQEEIQVNKTCAVVTISDPLNVRATPGGAIIGAIEKDQVVHVTKESGEWSYVQCEITSGWVATRYLKEIAKEEENVVDIDTLIRQATPEQWREAAAKLLEYGTMEQAAVLVDKAEIYRAKLAPSEWADMELTEAVDCGITDGTRPKAHSTREEVAIMVKRGVMKGGESGV